MMDPNPIQPERLASRAVDGSFTALELPALLLRPALYARSGSLEVRQAGMMSLLTFRDGRLVAAYTSGDGPPGQRRAERDQARAVIAAIIAGDDAMAWFEPSIDGGSAGEQTDLDLFDAVWLAALAQYTDTAPAQWAATMARRGAAEIDGAAAFMRQSGAKPALIQVLQQPQQCPSSRTLGALVMCGLLRLDPGAAQPGADESGEAATAPVQLNPAQRVPEPPAPEPPAPSPLELEAAAPAAEPNEIPAVAEPSFRPPAKRRRTWLPFAIAGAAGVGVVTLIVLSHHSPKNEGLADVHPTASATRPASDAPTRTHAGAAPKASPPAAAPSSAATTVPAQTPPPAGTGTAEGVAPDTPSTADAAAEPSIPDGDEFASARRPRSKRGGRRRAGARGGGANAASQPTTATTGSVPVAAGVQSPQQASAAAAAHPPSKTVHPQKPRAQQSSTAKTTAAEGVKAALTASAPSAKPTASGKTAADYYARGAQLLKSKQALPALQALKHCISLQPDYALAYRLLGQVYAMLGRDGEAIEAFQKFVTLAPNNADAPRLRRIIANYRAQ